MIVEVLPCAAQIRKRTTWGQGMHRAILFAVSQYVLTGPASAMAPLPADVTRFIARRQDCDTLRGEDPTTMGSTAEVDCWADATNWTCKGLDKRLLHLRKKYLKRPDVLNALTEFDLIERP